jgi:lysozyme
MDVCNALPAVVGSLTDGQYAALIDFVFNVGAGAFNGSTLCHYIRTGNMVLAPGQFGLWVHGRVNGQEVVLPGLVRRRAAEVAVWNTSS